MHPGRAAAAGGVGVAEVEPARPVVGEHPARLAEDVPHGVHVGGGGVLVAVLAGHAVVPLAPVGRAGDDAVRRLVGHPGEDRAGVADVERPRLAFRERGRAVGVSHRASALSAGEPGLRLVDDAGEHAVDLRGGAGGGEQEPEDQAHDRVPDLAGPCAGKRRRRRSP